MHGLENEESEEDRRTLEMCVCLRVSRVVAISESPSPVQGSPACRNPAHRGLEGAAPLEPSHLPAPPPPILNTRPSDALGAGCHLQ